MVAVASSLIPNGAPLRGPFFTRRAAARRAGLAPAALAAHPGAVRIGGPFGGEEVYPAFQFSRTGGFVPGLPEVVETLMPRFPAEDVAAWLLIPQPALGSHPVVDWLAEGRNPQPVLALARALAAPTAA